jgi:hypothetical protein
MYQNYSEDDGSIGMELVNRIPEATWEKSGKKALININKNHNRISNGKSISQLRLLKDKYNSAIIIAAGPSIKRHNPLIEIKKQNYKGLIATTDSGINYCLKNNVVPDLVVTVDPDESRIVRWFGDPNLSEKATKDDDYFRRQELDDEFNSNELGLNQKLIKSINKSCKDVKIALSTSSSTSVVNRVMDIGMDIYWWNPMLDDPGQENSYTLDLHNKNKLPCINSGGNVGATTWMILDAVLEIKNIALTGFDFSYNNDSSFYNTQNYYSAVDLVGKNNLNKFFIPVHNHILDEWYYTDPQYMYYKKIFLEMVKYSKCTTYNCSMGGILFGDNIKFTNLSTFLKKME